MAILRVFLFVILFCLASLLFLIQVPPPSRIPDPLSKHRLYPSNLTLINLPHFKYLINSDVCAQQHVYLVLLVTSHPANRKLRDAIRQILPQDYLNRVNVKRIFLLAKAESQQTDYPKVAEEELKFENLQTADILMGNFVESYRNLTYKHIMGLQWATRYCEQARWILKMDDDIALDVFQMLNILHNIESARKKQETSEKLLGYLQLGMIPLRNATSKWFVTWKEYPASEYDPFLSGWAYVLTPTIADKLVHEATKVPYFWIDDVHITGTLAKRLGIERLSLNSYYTVYAEFLHCCYTLPDHRRKLCDFAVGPTLGDPNTMQKFLWQAKHCYHNQCTKRTRSEKVEKQCLSVPKRSTVLGRGKGEVIALRL